jgi:Zn-dependent protease with chaperone function
MFVEAIAPPQPTGLYGWIQSNNSRSLQFFAGFAVAVQMLAAILLIVPLSLMDEAHSPVFGLGGYVMRYVPLILIASIVLFIAQLFWHMETVKRRAGFRYVDATDEPRLCRILEPLIVQMMIPVPFVAVIETAKCNAFACGISRKHAVVVVTRGLIEVLNDHELEAVLAHELTHIRNGDIRLMAAANICMGNLAEMDKANILQFRHWSQAILCVLFPFFFPMMLLGGFVGQVAMRTARKARLAITSSREFIADAEAAQITKNPAALASALVRIRGRDRIDTIAPKDDAMMISGVEHGDDATHPAVQERIDALTRVTGSMVFIAPGAAPMHELGGVERSALFGRAAFKAQALERTEAAEDDPSRTDIFGLTKQTRFFLALAVAVFLGVNILQLGDWHAMRAKFDIRSWGETYGTTFDSGQLRSISVAEDPGLAAARELVRNDRFEFRSSDEGSNKLASSDE